MKTARKMRRLEEPFCVEGMTERQTLRITMRPAIARELSLKEARALIKRIEQTIEWSEKYHCSS